MNKQYHNWVSDMSGTVDDNTWAGKCIDSGGQPQPEKLTEAQIRLRFADILADWRQAPNDWVKAYFLALIDKNNTAFPSRGSKHYRAYQDIDDAGERHKYLDRLRKRIENKEIGGLYDN